MLCIGNFEENMDLSRCLDVTNHFFLYNRYVGEVHVDCEGGKKFVIEERKFGTTSPPEIEDKEFDEYEDNAQLVLITLNTTDPSKGFIKESIYKERLEKSDTGLPLVK